MGQVMATPDRDKRPPLAVAAELASQVISIALMMALPAWAGYWGDQKLGTSPWLVVTGAVLGLVAGMTQLLRGMAGTKRKTGDENRTTNGSRH
jgi:F0F1-type ATP synthase assembly protein I